jgi:hypothetical protein
MASRFSENVRRICRTSEGVRVILSRMFARTIVTILGGGLVFACGGTIDDARQNSNLGGAQSRTEGNGGWSTTTGGRGGAVAVSGSSTYVELGCLEQPVPEVYSECEPLSDSNPCASGEACYPVTLYPSRACESEQFQNLCLPSGHARQWERCSTLTDCASGYTCVVTDDGTMCLKMCDPRASKPCADGQFCDAIDLQEIGTCF